MKLLIKYRLIFISLLIIPVVVLSLENLIYKNPSISEPVGYYLTIPYLKYGKGDQVITCISSNKHKQVLNQLGLTDTGECPNGLPTLLKTIAAESGDVVLITKDGVEVNGYLQKNSQLFETGRGFSLYPLPLGWEHKLAPGEFFMLGDSTHSFDSRYFGIVRSNEIIRRAILIIPTQK